MSETSFYKLFEQGETQKRGKNDLVDLMLDCIKDDSNGNNGDEETTDQYEKDM
jgi:hypothetical protein